MEEAAQSVEESNQGLADLTQRRKDAEREFEEKVEEEAKAWTCRKEREKTQESRGHKS